MATFAEELANQLGNKVKIVDKGTTVTNATIKANNDIKVSTIGQIELTFGEEESWQQQQT